MKGTQFVVQCRKVEFMWKVEGKGVEAEVVSLQSLLCSRKW